MTEQYFSIYEPLVTCDSSTLARHKLTAHTVTLGLGLMHDKRLYRLLVLHTVLWARQTYFHNLLVHDYFYPHGKVASQNHALGLGRALIPCKY